MMSIIKILLTALMTSTLTHAVNVNFEGFVHFNNWHGRLTDSVTFTSAADGNTQVLPTLSKDLCGDGCDSFGNWPPKRTFRTFIHNSSYDMFLAFNTTIVKGAICAKEIGGCTTPTQQWLACNNDMFLSFSTLNHFQLPPSLIHSACLSDPLCIGIRVNNDQGSGDTLQAGRDTPGAGGVAHGWFKID